jgi:hypothetical protein
MGSLPHLLLYSVGPQSIILTIIDEEANEPGAKML